MSSSVLLRQLLRWVVPKHRCTCWVHQARHVRWLSTDDLDICWASLRRRLADMCTTSTEQRSIRILHCNVSKYCVCKEPTVACNDVCNALLRFGCEVAQLWFAAALSHMLFIIVEQFYYVKLTTSLTVHLDQLVQVPWYSVTEASWHSTVVTGRCKSPC